MTGPAEAASGQPFGPRPTHMVVAKGSPIVLSQGRVPDDDDEEPVTDEELVVVTPLEVLVEEVEEAPPSPPGSRTTFPPQAA